ncbi:MAG: helix-turn-helix transcriptional regulator [Lachnospiraceae bacterium]|nr:helix-turn-helix transcriptional regulator [Lachnospiraceae bacterium]
MRKPYFENANDIEENKKIANTIMGKRIKELRITNKPKKDTQPMLAEYLNLGKKKGNKRSKGGGKQTISNAERGVRSLPANLLPIIADKYNTSVESFFNEDKVFVLSENVFYQIVSRLNASDETKINAIKYMSVITDSAIEKVGAEKLFDIIFKVTREASFGNTDGMRIGADIDAINRFHEETEGKSLYLESAVTYAKEIGDNSNYKGKYNN